MLLRLQKEAERFRRLLQNPDVVQELDRTSGSKTRGSKQLTWDAVFRYFAPVHSHLRLPPVTRVFIHFDDASFALITTRPQCLPVSHCPLTRLAVVLVLAIRFLQRYVQRETESTQLSRANVTSTTMATRHKKMAEMCSLVKYFVRCANKRVF